MNARLSKNAFDELFLGLPVNSQQIENVLQHSGKVSQQSGKVSQQTENFSQHFFKITSVILNPYCNFQ